MRILPFAAVIPVDNHLFRHIPIACATEVVKAALDNRINHIDLFLTASLLEDEIAHKIERCASWSNIGSKLKLNCY